MPKKKRSAGKQPAQMRWEFGHDIPTHDFFERRNLDQLWDLQEAVENFVFKLEQGDFLAWEAVICEEQGLRLTAHQKKAMESLVSFGEDEDDQILYLNETARPSEPWYVILNKIVPHLLMEPYRTFDFHEDVICDGWQQIMSALKKHGQGLSLPPDVESPEDALPAELRHKLWLQCCFANLGGLRPGGMSLEDPEEHIRIDWFIKNLRKFRDSVAYFGLTLESLMTKLILPEKDQPIFVSLMKEKLGLSSAQEPIAARL